MFKEIKNKIIQKIKSSPVLQSRDQWSFYRFYIFIFSYRGQKRLWNFTGRLTAYLYRKLFGLASPNSDLYATWRKNNVPDNKILKKYSSNISEFKYRPVISILMKVTESSIDHFKKSIDSILKQIYTNFELVTTLGIEPEGEFKKYLDYLNSLELNIKVNIVSKIEGAENSYFNDAISHSSGDFILFLEPGNLISPDALYQVAAEIVSDQSAGLIYADHDYIDNRGNLSNPYFKQDWCSDSILSRNYIGQAVFFKSTLVKQLSVFDSMESDIVIYDLILKVSEKCDHIIHISKILFSIWEHNNTVKNEKSGIKILEAALKRRGIEGKVIPHPNADGIFVIRYKIINPGKVSVVIPTKNRHKLCEVAINSIFSLTDYPDFEIILVDNNSDEEAFFEMIQHYNNIEPNRFRCIKDAGVFNFSRIINKGVSVATGEYLLMLNNDTEVLQRDWMSAMVEYCQFKSNGVAGVKLLYPNDTIQHAGVIVGLGGIANHPFVGNERNDPGYFNQLYAVTNYSAVTAACFMVRRDIFDEVHGFEENLAVEFNDVDFCLKVCEKGYKNALLPHIVLYHYESISRGHPHKTRRSYKLHLADINTFRTKWQKYIDHDPCYNQNLTRIFTDFRIRIQEL